MVIDREHYRVGAIWVSAPGSHVHVVVGVYSVGKGVGLGGRSESISSIKAAEMRRCRIYLFVIVSTTFTHGTPPFHSSICAIFSRVGSVVRG